CGVSLRAFFGTETATAAAIPSRIASRRLGRVTIIRAGGFTPGRGWPPSRATRPEAHLPRRNDLRLSRSGAADSRDRDETAPARPPDPMPCRRAAELNQNVAP